MPDARRATAEYLQGRVRSQSVRFAAECWADEHAVHHRFSPSGKPSQNGFIESINRKLREECLNEHEFINL